MRRAHLHSMLFLMAAGDGGAGGGAPDLVEVDLFDGVKVKMTKDEAAKAIAGRDALKASARDASTKLVAAEAAQRAADEKVAAALRDKEAADAAKTGDMVRVKELHTTELRAEREKLGSKLRDKALAAIIAATPKVVPKAIDDIAAALRSAMRYDFESDKIIAHDSAGQPIKDDSGKTMDADAFVGKWLGERPWLLLDSTPSGSGAGGAGKPPATAATMTRADYDAAQKDPVRAQQVSRDLVAKKLVLVD